MLSTAQVIACPAILLLLAAEPAAAAAPGARAELDACAARIEALKARQEDSAELERLLRRAQELASELERGRSAAGRELPAAPSPEELHERADAARDVADRLSADIAALDVRIGDLRRAEAGDQVQRAAIASGPGSSTDARLRALLAERAALAQRRAHVLAEATRLDEEARVAEREP